MFSLFFLFDIGFGFSRFLVSFLLLKFVRIRFQLDMGIFVFAFNFVFYQWVKGNVLFVSFEIFIIESIVIVQRSLFYFVFLFLYLLELFFIVYFSFFMENNKYISFFVFR